MLDQVLSAGHKLDLPFAGYASNNLSVDLKPCIALEQIYYSICTTVVVYGLLLSGSKLSPLAVFILHGAPHPRVTMDCAIPRDKEA